MTETTTTALAIPTAQLQQLEEIAKSFSISNIGNLGSMTMALTVATGIEQLNKALTPEVMRPIMALRGNRLGFLTDRDNDPTKEPYPEEVVKRCVVECLIRGARPVLNEMNIIAARFYATRECFTRLLKEYPGMSDLRIDLDVPRVPKEGVGGGGCVVECRATWKIKGAADHMEAKIPIRVNQGMGADAILGKADRKFKKRIYDYLTGSDLMPDGDIDEKNVTPRAAAGSSGLDAFAGAGPTLDVQPEEIDQRPGVADEDWTQGEPGPGAEGPQAAPAPPPPPSAAAAPPPPPPAEFLAETRIQGLKRMAKQGKLTDEDLIAVIERVVGKFKWAEIPTRHEPEILRQIKQAAEKKK